MKHFRISRVVLSFLIFLYTDFVLAENGIFNRTYYQLGFPSAATKIAEDITYLHWIMLIICGFIFCIVFGVMFYSLYKYRRSSGHHAVNIKESAKLEVFWTTVSLFIIIGMAFPATKTIIAMRDTDNADITVKITGYQWKWGYDYINGEGEGISFIQNLSTPKEQINNNMKKSDTYLLEVDHEMVVPIGKKIRLITTANDVIHSWAIPAFGVKQDAIPGFVRDTWFRAEKIGTYRGQCSELCGKEHAFMPNVVRVVEQQEYSKWVEETKKSLASSIEDPDKIYTLDELKKQGARVYSSNCAVCHMENGQGSGFFPNLNESKIVLGPKEKQYKILLRGKGAMPKWSQLSDTDLASVMTYTRNNWNNNTGELIQPKDFAIARTQQ